MAKVNLETLINEIKTYMGITRKHPISDVINSFPTLKNQLTNFEVLADFGEDAAVLSLSPNSSDDGVLLLAADGIMASLMDSDPYWAGYCSVLVNLHDIAAMGGLPLAIVDIISAKEPKVLKTLTAGMNAASQKFGVPIVGGHLHPDSEFDAVDVAILGIGKRENIIYSHSAQLNDDVIFAMDLDGQLHPNAKFAWDTTQHKKDDQVRKQLMVMADLGSDAVIHSGKDISNPGALGTLGMLLESSRKGALVDLLKIPRPDDKNIEFIHWLKVYQGCGFVVTCDKSDSKSILDKFESVGLSAEVSGKIIGESKLTVRSNSEQGTLFDFNSEKITGIWD